MKILNIYTACVWVILLTNINCYIIIRRDKRSVFDLINNIDKGDMDETSLDFRSNNKKIVLSKALTDNKPIKYQELKNMFINKVNEEKQITRNKRRKEEVKQQFLVESHKEYKAKFEKRKHENIIVNFSFLTKMS